MAKLTIPTHLKDVAPRRAAAHLERIASGGAFAKPVTLSRKQLEAFGDQLSTLAKKEPKRAAELLQRAIDLYKEGKITVSGTVEVEASLTLRGDRWGAARGNAFAQMAGTVSIAIKAADPTVKTPAPLPTDYKAPLPYR